MSTNVAWIFTFITTRLIASVLLGVTAYCTFLFSTSIFYLSQTKHKFLYLVTILHVWIQRKEQCIKHSANPRNIPNELAKSMKEIFQTLYFYVAKLCILRSVRFYFEEIMSVYLTLWGSRESNTGLHSCHHDRVAKDHFWCFLLWHEFLVKFDKSQQVIWKTLSSHKQSDLICDFISSFNIINCTILNSMSSMCPFLSPPSYIYFHYYLNVH